MLQIRFGYCKKCHVPINPTPGVMECGLRVKATCPRCKDVQVQPLAKFIIFI